MGKYTTYYAKGVMYYPDNSTRSGVEIQVEAETEHDAKHEAIRQGMLQIFTIKHWTEVEGDDYV